MKILIVDDDKNISNILNIALESEGYETTVINNPLKAKELIIDTSFDLILLDIMMPEMDGYDLCRHARGFTDAPIIFITCLDDEKSLLSALELGGDDYIKKPFNISEVLMRIKVHLRRINKNKLLIKSQIYKTDTFTFNHGRNLVTTDYDKIFLSPLEGDLLNFFLTNKNIVLTYKNIYETIWHEEYLNDKSTIMARISNLRTKVPQVQIETIRGVGYKFI